MGIRLLATLTLLAVMILGGVVYAYVYLDSWGKTALQLTAPAEIDFPRGTSLPQLSRQLQEQQIIAHDGIFQIWVRLHTDYSKFQAGSYRFEGPVSPETIAFKMRNGEVFQRVALELRILEGFTVRQVAEKLVQSGVGTMEFYERLMHDPEFLHSLKIPGASLEGYLYPATYTFEKLPTPDEAIRTAVETFWKKLPKDYEQNVSQLGLTLDEAVRFASLIELETPHDDERSTISEVIWRRLKESIPLGIDAAIIYGIKDYDGDIKNAHLRDSANPYNLRIHPGLPPSAIGSPTVESLQAVFTPTHEGVYYYVLDAKEPGRHRFAKTAAEHNANVKEYVREIKKRRAAAKANGTDGR